MGDHMKCVNCGAEVKKKIRNGREQKFCDLVCYREYIDRNSNKPAYVICHYCGKTFLEKHSTLNLYCSKHCASKAHGAKHMVTVGEATKNPYEEMLRYQIHEVNERLEELINELQYGRECVECGKYFIAKGDNVVCCSKKCAKRRQNRNKDKRITKNGAADTTITLTKLYMRDKGVCQICGKHIDFDCDPNSKHYPSIDHIQPIAKGGLHTWDNVQLACRKCNTIKRDTYTPPPS